MTKTAKRIKRFSLNAVFFLVFLGFGNSPFVYSMPSDECQQIASEIFKVTNLSASSERASQNAFDFISELKVVDGFSRHQFDVDNFWLGYQKIANPKTNWSVVPEDRIAYFLRVDKAKELSERFPKLTLHEALAVRKYTQDSGPVNIALYNLDLEGIKIYKDYINSLSSALGKLERFKGSVYRIKKGIPLEEMRKKYVVGETIEEPGFISASQDSFFAPPGRDTTLFYIKSKNGRMVHEFSGHENEKEVLFDIGSKFRVVEVKMSDPSAKFNKKLEIFLEEE